MRVMPSVKPSPRVECGAICWYEGDTCEIEFHISIKDDDGNPVALLPSDIIALRVYDVYNRDIANVDYTNVQDNIILWKIDEEMTAKFPRGRYFYDITHQNGYVTTVCDRNRMIVE